MSRSIRSGYEKDDDNAGLGILLRWTTDCHWCSSHQLKVRMNRLAHVGTMISHGVWQTGPGQKTSSSSGSPSLGCKSRHVRSMFAWVIQQSRGKRQPRFRLRRRKVRSVSWLAILRILTTLTVREGIDGPPNVRMEAMLSECVPFFSFGAQYATSIAVCETRCDVEQWSQSITCGLTRWPGKLRLLEGA